MVWTATSIVAADVTDRPAPVVAHQDVLSELQSGASTANQTTTSTTPPADTSTTTAPRGRGPATAVPAAPEPAAPPPQTPQPGVAITPVVPPTTAPQPPPTAPPTTPPAPQPPPVPMATYSTSGGVVRVACSGFFISLVSAIPNSGYTVNVVAGGPANVDVRFVGPGQDLSVRAVCFGDPIRY